MVSHFCLACFLFDVEGEEAGFIVIVVPVIILIHGLICLYSCYTSFKYTSLKPKNIFDRPPPILPLRTLLLGRFLLFSLILLLLIVFVLLKFFGQLVDGTIGISEFGVEFFYGLDVFVVFLDLLLRWVLLNINCLNCLCFFVVMLC